MKITVQFDYAVDDRAMGKMLRFFCVNIVLNFSPIPLLASCCRENAFFWKCFRSPRVRFSLLHDENKENIFLHTHNCSLYTHILLLLLLLLLLLMLCVYNYGVMWFNGVLFRKTNNVAKKKGKITCNKCVPLGFF